MLRGFGGGVEIIAFNVFVMLGAVVAGIYMYRNSDKQQVASLLVSEMICAILDNARQVEINRSAATFGVAALAIELRSRKVFGQVTHGRYLCHHAILIFTQESRKPIRFPEKP